MSAITVTVIKRPNSHNYYVRWTDPVTFRERRRSTKTRIKRDAERYALKIEKELNQGTHYDLCKISWQEFRTRYETEVIPGLAQRTSEKVSVVFNAVQQIVKPKLLLQVDSNSISKMVKHYRKKGLQEITIRSNLAHLKAALNWAKQIRLLHVVPDFPKLKRARTEKVMRGRPLCLEEFERMLASVSNIITIKGDSKECKQKEAEIQESWKFYLRGLWYSGLRLSESLELYWDREDKLSVDLSGKYPMLRIRAEAEKGNKDRLLPIVPEFASFLEEVPEDLRTGPVFNPRAIKCYQERMTAAAVSKKIADIGEDANIVVGDKGNIDKKTGKRKPRFASAHDLRRSFGERWAMKVMPQALMQLMRHESMETTLKFYVGRNAEKIAEAVWNADQSGSVYNPVISSQNEENPELEEERKTLHFR
ncbi:tyrosine-type recombinase/integrase [Gimesia chilikensis]|uniref:tyrosine-type recombinase/integrase n=1 Tax=Gimesia chilikensis TaxID=2605989 RepID=UPI001189B659|nr:site-specific integrase [Gimesia chilikensis]QDT84780.1 site-specific tyrosine recombinase XerC [Gimesia chilikensis]